MMNALLKEIYVLKFNKALIMQKSMAALRNQLLLTLICVPNSVSSCRPDYEAGLRDFKNRLANYEKVFPQPYFYESS